MVEFKFDVFVILVDDRMVFAWTETCPTRAEINAVFNYNISPSVYNELVSCGQVYTGYDKVNLIQLVDERKKK